MTSLALRLREDLRSSTVKTVLEYLDTPDSPTDLQKQKKIQALVTNILNGCWPKTVVYLPLAGKPNTSFPLDPLLKTPRSRVLQQGQKENTCLYYALQRIRMHVGKKPTEQFAFMREMEQKASQWRKDQSRIDKTYKWQLKFAKEEVPGSGLITKKNIAALLEQIDTLLSADDLEKVLPVCKEFSKSNFDTLLKFVEANYYRALWMNDQAYLLSHSTTIKYVYDNERRSLYSREWKDLHIDFKIECVRNCVFRLTYEKYGLKHSLWHPTQPIIELGKQIEDHGPHVIIGHFGKGYYEKPPFDTVRKLQGRCIYGWRPNAKRIDREGEHHAIVLVGVDCAKNHIFFIDPINPSDPKQPKQEKIYVISYDNLRRNISSLNVMNYKTETGDPKLPLENSYAIHGDPELARL